MPPTTHSESDSDDDLDYVPPADDYDSDNHDDEHDELGPSSRTALPVAPADSAEQKTQRDALWASFQASVSTPPANGNGAPSAQPPPVKRIKIEKTYLFAGKHVTDVVEVPEDSEDAKKWPKWSPRPEPTSGAASASASASTPSCEKGKEVVKEEANGNGDSPTPPPVTSVPAVPSPATSTLGAKRPGPRKPRATLPSIPNKTSQAKKITTLDKSAMDWRAHVASQSSNVKDELDANKRGGGYLEKVEFLKRVEDRREDAFEANKASKRRKT